MPDRSSEHPESGLEVGGIEQPLVRLQRGGSRTPIGVALAVLVVLAAVVWQPWGRASSSPAVASTPSPGTRLAGVPSPIPSQSSSPISAGPAAYLSLIDNEWTVVALLSATTAVPVGEPALPHPSSPTASTKPLLVLQQGLNYSLNPIEQPGNPDLPCQAQTAPRLRFAVPLPANRVIYLGVTFPGVSPLVKVTAADLDRDGLLLARVPSLVVSLSGRPVDASYRLPSAGPGALVVFALARGTALPNASYRFDIELPGGAHRYLYACVGA